MQDSDHKFMEGSPAEETTAVTMRSIKDILGESFHDRLLLTSADRVRPQEHIAADPEALREPEPVQNCASGKTPSFTKRLTAKLFGG
ncbi:MAG: hypothetical protein ABJL99_23380 [Aliishimia sp.]